MNMKYSIPIRSRLCTSCGQKFLPGSSCYTLLEDERRSDSCKECYVVDEKGIFWEVSIPEKKNNNDNTALILLRKLYSEKKGSTLFILALYLERNKQLLRRSSKKEELIFEEPQSGELFFIETKVVTKERQDEIKEELSKYFSDCKVELLSK